jgi:hypothetical protein
MLFKKVKLLLQVGKVLRDVIGRTLKESLLELMEEEEMMMVERTD